MTLAILRWRLALHALQNGQGFSNPCQWHCWAETDGVVTDIEGTPDIAVLYFRRRMR